MRALKIVSLSCVFCFGVVNGSGAQSAPQLTMDDMTSSFNILSGASFNALATARAENRMLSSQLDTANAKISDLQKQIDERKCKAE